MTKTSNSINNNRCNNQSNKIYPNNNNLNNNKIIQ